MPQVRDDDPADDGPGDGEADSAVPEMSHQGGDDPDVELMRHD